MSGLEVFINLLEAKKNEDLERFHSIIRNSSVEQKEEIISICENTVDFMKDYIKMQKRNEEIIQKYTK